MYLMNFTRQVTLDCNTTKEVKQKCIGHYGLRICENGKRICSKSFRSQILNAQVCVYDTLQTGISSGELMYFTGRAISETCNKTKEGKQKCIGQYGLTVCENGKPNYFILLELSE